MPYVDRTDGLITGRYTAAQYPEQEYVPDDSPDLLPPLSEILDARHDAINAMRDAACTSDVSVTINGTAYRFQADQRSQNLVMGAVMGIVAGVAGPPPTWRSSDNIDVPIVLVDLQNIGKAMIQKTTLAYEKSWALKAQADALKTADELTALDVSTGWPV